MTNRPAEFDRRLVAHIPNMKRAAWRRAKGDDSAEILQDALAHALAKWATFRNEAGDYVGFATWCSWQVRAVVEKRRESARAAKRAAKFAPFDRVTPTVAPRQENIVYAGQVVRRLSRSRDGRILLQAAKGESKTDIGKRRGITGERVRQLSERARERITRTAA